MSNNKGDSLGDRMKSFEAISSGRLMKRTPVIIRLDGKSFHTFTKKINSTNDPSMVDQPFSQKLHKVMSQTMVALCNSIQNAKIGYSQSDEISILLTDWTTFTTDQWFGGNVQKIVSVSASLATAYFNHYYAVEFNVNYSEVRNLAFFDSRVFNLPKEEVNNYFIWRQNDASRNSVQMLGHYHFSQKQMHCKNNSEIQDMLMLEKGVNWNDTSTWKKRGFCYHTNQLQLDVEIPIFTQSKDYINNYIKD